MKSEIYKDKKGEFRVKLTADNGETIFVSSEGYKRKRDAQNAINLLEEAFSKLNQDSPIVQVVKLGETGQWNEAADGIRILSPTERAQLKDIVDFISAEIER